MTAEGVSVSRETGDTEVDVTGQDLQLPVPLSPSPGSPPAPATAVAHRRGEEAWERLSAGAMALSDLDASPIHPRREGSSRLDTTESPAHPLAAKLSVSRRQQASSLASLRTTEPSNSTFSAGPSNGTGEHEPLTIDLSQGVSSPPGKDRTTAGEHPDSLDSKATLPRESFGDEGGLDSVDTRFHKDLKVRGTRGAEGVDEEGVRVTWSCLVCTLINEESARVCAACANKKPTSKVRGNI